MSKWTPWTSGPWTHETKVPVDISRSPEFLLGCAHEPGIGETGIANARLIAAATEMAELLERIVNSDMAQMAEDEGRVCAELSDARALLARLEADK